MRLEMEKTSIPETFKAEFDSMYNVEVLPKEVLVAYKGLFLAIGDFLRGVKKKKAKTCLVVSDIAGDFIMAGVVEYNESEDKESQDNWNFYFTFNEEDIKDATNKHVSTETPFKVVLGKRLAENSLKISESEYIDPMVCMLCNKISSFLDQNAKKDEEVELVLDEIFIATVAIEDDKPVKSLLPGGEVKYLIKDDASTEKDVA